MQDANTLRQILREHINSERFTTREIHHVGEHVDIAFMHIALAAQILVNVIKHDKERKRKGDDVKDAVQ